jgi:drug/metabolite transporter (DMT)-like permease
MTAALSPSISHRANMIGSLWMVAAMAAFAVEDAFIKAAAVQLPVGQVLMLFGAGGSILFAALAAFRKEALLTPAVLSRPMRIRFVFELTGRLFYGLALALTPLSSATAILQATPIVVVLGAALFFGETVGWRRWAAILAGLAGVLLILQPAPGSFSALSLLAVIGMLGFAGRDLASRAAPQELSTSALGFYGFLTVLIAGAAYSVWSGEEFTAPGLTAAAFLVGASFTGVFAYAGLMKAMRTGEVATVTPFRYTRLLFGLSLGIIIFGERPDAATVAGCAIVVASGLFILWRGRAK